MNNPVSEEQMQQMQEKIKDVSTSFSKHFVLGYKDGLVQKIKDEAEPDEESPEQLLSPTPPDWDLKVGTFTKRGYNNTAYKKRYFVAKNEADCFEIEYYDKEGGKLKGKLCCAGYAAAKADATKDKKSKPNGIVLTPSDESRRVYYFGCEDEAQQEEWLEVFKNACQKGSVPEHVDPLVQTGFVRGFNKAKESQGYYWSWSFDRAPAEMIAKLMYCVVDRDVLADIIATITTPVIAARIIRTLQAQIRSMCLAAANAAWSGVAATIDALKGPFEQAVTPLLSTLVEAQVSLKTTIVEKAGEVTGPAMEKLGSIAIAPVVGIAMEPIVSAFAACLRDFKAELNARADTIKSEPDSKPSEVREGINDVGWNYYSRSPMRTAYQIMSDFESGPLAALADAMDGMPLWRFVYDVLEDMRALLKRAWFTFGELTGEVDANVVELMSRLVHDVKLGIGKIVTNAFNSLIGEWLIENVTTPALDLIAPVTEMIPEALTEIINLEALLEDVIADVLGNAIETGCVASIEGSVAGLDNWEAA